jgi:hypothetical protein
MPDADILDLDAIGRAAGAVADSPQPAPPLDLDAIGRSVSADDLIARETRKASLRSEMAGAGTVGDVADVVSRFDPLGTFFRGLRATGNVLAGAGEDVLSGKPGWENVNSALTTYQPTPYEQELAKDRGVAAGLKSGVIGMVKTAPTLAAAAAITAVTKLPPAFVYPPIFAGETYEATGDPYQAVKSGTLGALYLGVGQVVKPIAAGLINRFGLVNNPTAQKAIETTVDQALLQAVGQVLNLPEYTHMTPEERNRAIAESFSANAVFALPRVLGYAAGHPSEYEGAIRQEAGRLTDYFAQQREQEYAATPEGVREERIYRRARLLAAQSAAEQGIPVEVKPEPAPIPEPPVEEIEPFGTVRQFRVTRQFVNPADEGVYKVDDIITEPQLLKAGIEVPKPKEVPSAIPIKSADETVVQPTPGGSETVGAGIRKAPEEPAGTGQAEVKAADAETGGEKVVAVAVRTPTGEIYTGPLHPLILSEIGGITEQGKAKPGFENGFLTDKGRFVNRDEAYRISGIREGSVIASGGTGVVNIPPEAPRATKFVEPAGARITLRNNIAADLPEFTLEAINRRLPEPRTGRTFPASVIYDPKQKGFLLIKGPAQRATYKIPLAEIPHEIVKGGINVDKATVLAFLSDKAKRQAAIVDDRNVTHYAPEDIDLIVKPFGRPATGAGTPLQPVPLEELPKVQKKVGQPVSGRRPMLDITRRAFDDLREKNPQLVEQLLGRRPEELDDAFWNGIRDELLRENEEIKKLPDPVAAADALVNDLRRLKDGNDLEWQMAISQGGGLSDLPLPYGLTQTDVDAAGGIKQALEAAYERTKADAARERASDIWSWNTQNRRWGQVWSDYKQDQVTRNWRVVAGLEGDLRGLDVATFRTEEAARQFAKDFREGRIFALENNERWVRMVESAEKARPFTDTEGTSPRDLKLALHARGRATGVTPEGQSFDIFSLRNSYERPLQASVPKGWEGIPGTAQNSQEAANIQEARALVEHPLNGLDEEHRAVLRDILNSPVAGYLNGRQIRFRLVDGIQGRDRGLAGFYDPVDQIIEVARYRDPFVGAHEFFHPLWEMVQDSDRLNVKRWRDDAIARALQTATGKDLADLQKLAAGEMGYRRFIDEGIDNKFYNWSSSEEFFAHMMTDRFARDRQGIWGQAKEILASQDAFLSKVRQILAVIFDAIRQRVPGLRTQADILQRTILDGKYDVTPETSFLSHDTQAGLEGPSGMWVSPEGDITPVSMFEHEFTARRLLGEDFKPGKGVPEYQLDKKRYARGVFDRKSNTLLVDATQPLTNTARRAVKDYAIEHGINAVFGTDTSISYGLAKDYIHTGHERGTQAAIDEQFDELKDKGSHILRAGPGDVEIELDINKKQLMALVGPQMYSKPIVEVATKELLQNAFDTARSAGATYENPGTIEIKTDYSNRTLMVKDTGTGMTPEIIRTAFFTIGGTYKTGSLENTSGGLGLAKMAFILGSEHIRVESNRNGLKSVVDASSDQIRSSKFKIQTERTDEPNGTTVTVKIPENYTDAYGEQKSIYFNSYPSFLTQPLIGPVRVIFNGTELPIGVKLEGWQKENEFNFGWGRIDLYIDPREKRDYPTTHVLSAGLKQFEADPYGWNDKKLPYNLILDVRPKVKTDNAAYPFNNQREGWRATIKEDVDAMYTFLKRMAVEQELLQAKEAFTSIRQLEKVDPMKDWTPEEMADMERRYFRKKSEPPPPIRKPKEIESVDFRGPDVVIHYRDGTAITESKQEYVRKTFEAKREIDLKKTEIDVSDMDPSVPNLHNNVAVEFDDIPRAGTLITETGNVLLNFMREWGKKVGGEYEQLTDASITGWFGGISFDKNYRGLNMVKPMRAIWFNLGLFSNAGRSSPAAAASEALHIFIHEITHVAARTEGADFTAELANNYARLRSADIPVEIFEGTLDKIFTTNWEAFNEINDRLQNYNTRNRAESFQSSSAVGPERPGEAARPGEGPLGVNAPGVVGIPEQGRAGLGRTGPADRAAGPIGDILAGQARAEPPSISRSRGTQAALESRQAVEEYVKPLEETRTPEYFRAMASVINKGLVPSSVIPRYTALPAGIRGELEDMFGGRIGTHRETGPTFAQVMADPNITPEKKAEHAHNAFVEWNLYQAEKLKILSKVEAAAVDHAQAITDRITATPETNEAQVERTNRLGEIIDKIHTEQIAVGEKAHTNAVIGEGIEHIAELNDLLSQPVAHARALSGITRLVGRAALTAERPGENVLELIATQTGSPGLSPPLTVRAWVRQLATHLDQIQTPEGNKAINAGRDVIEATLWGLRQIGDWRQALLEVQMTADGTLRRFNADYLNDLRSRTPRGFNAILKEYAKAQVESDALSAAARRLDRRIETLTEKKANLEAAAQFLNEHDANPEFVAFGKQMQRATGAIKDIKNTVDGVVVTYEHPLTGADVEVDYRFGGQVELLLKLNALKDAGLEYAARPDADPIKAAGWMHFAEYIDAQILASHADNDRLTDPSWFNPIKWFNFVTKSKYGLISATTASRIPGALNLKMIRAGNAYSLALKTNNALQKKFDEIIRGTNLKAMRSHPGMTLDRWRDEVASFIHDSRQHTGQTLYNVGEHTPFGHVITKEDMAAIRTQYEFEQHLVRLAQRAGFESALAEDPAMIKEHELRMFRAPLSRGPGTIPRFLPPSSRELPALWKSARENNQIDQFLSAGDRYKRVVLGHVLEDERPYFQLGQGKFAEDYKRIRNEREILFREGRMPASLDELAQFIADRYNQRIAGSDPPLPPATAGEVRRKLIDEVNEFMLKVSDDNARKATAANVDITVHENEFTQPRGGKIAPGTLYRYGTTDPVDAFRKGANALEFYVIKYRDSLRSLNTALLAEKTALSKTLKDAYGGTGWQARRKLNAAIVSGNESVQKHQMAIWEVNRDIARIGRLLNNVTDIAKRGEGFFGDDIASRMFMPWWNFAVSNVLLAPMTLITNGVSGEFMWALKTAEIRKGGWLWVTGHLVKDWVRTAIKTAALAELKVPYLKWKGEPVSLRPGAKALRAMKTNAVKRLLDNRDLREAATEIVSGMAQEAADREQQARMGMIDRFSYREAMGTNAEWTLAENFKAAMAAFRDIHADPSLSGSKEAFGYIGMIPRAGQVLLRHGFMRSVDNWINVKSIAKEQSLGRSLEVRAMRAFDSRLENDPEFARLYREYGDNYKRFSGVLIGPDGKGELLSPAELTGKDPIIVGLTMRKAAVQLRNMFLENNDPVDLIMLKYWWNKTHPNGNRTAPIMTPAQRYALQFKMAEDTNMGTPTSRPTYFMGSKERQIGGVLGQWFLWNTDKLQELFAKVRGQKGSDVRYLPFVFGFLIASGIAGLVARIPGQRANDALFNTISSQPDFLDADNDDDRWKILLSVAANFWGAAGSIFKGFKDTPGKLGLRNPIFGANYVTDLLQTMAKIYQSRDAGPAVDFLARYSPVARALINRAPSREGLVKMRNAANELRANTPESLEAKRRQPSSGNDLRVTPMTPLYNTILNAAAVGDWSTADEAFAKAVEQSRASGNPNPEQAIISAIRTRAPESAVFSRVLTDGEREMIYSRMTPEALGRQNEANAVFNQIASRYGTGGGGATARSFGGGRGFGAVPSESSGAFSDIGGFGGSRSRLSLGSPRGVRSGFRSRSLRRGLRTRSLLRGASRRPRQSRLRRLAV